MGMHFAPLIDAAEAISSVLAQTKDATLVPTAAVETTIPDSIIDSGSENPFKNRPSVLDAPIKAILEPTLEKYKNLDRKMLLENAFKMRLLSLQDEMGTRVAALKDAIFRYLDLLLRCSELELVENNIPIHFIEEVLEFQTVERSEHIYDYLESRVERLTVNMVAGRGKGLTLLRICNELLRRLSKAKNTVYCGRILMLLSSVFPLTERSGVNMRGEFNTENITLVESEDVTVVPELVSTPSQYQKEEKLEVPTGESMDIDDDHSSKEAAAITKADDAILQDSAFYTEFWSLQAFFCNPMTLFTLRENMDRLHKGVENTLSRFAAIGESQQKARGQRGTSASSTTESASTAVTAPGSRTVPEQQMTNEFITTTKRKHSHSQDKDAGPTTYYPKFLTSPKLLKLEMVDPYFRKHILVQFLIIIQYLRTHTLAAKEAFAKIPTANKSFQPQWILEDRDREWTEAVKPKILRELKAAGLESGDNSFLISVTAVLNQERNWVQWKSESCPMFEKPSLTVSEVEETKAKRKKLSDALSPLKQKLGCGSLTELWEEVEFNNHDETGFGSFRPPPAVEEYLRDVPMIARSTRNARIIQRKPALSEKENKELEQARLWRALRLGSREYLEFYSKANKNPNYSTTALSEDIKAIEDREEKTKLNGGIVPDEFRESTESEKKSEEADAPAAAPTNADAAPAEDTQAEDNQTEKSEAVDTAVAEDIIESTNMPSDMAVDEPQSKEDATDTTTKDE